MKNKIMNRNLNSALTPIGLVKRKAEKLVSMYVDRQVRNALVRAEEDKVLRYREGAIDQVVCDKFLKCPDCLSESSLKYSKDNISCSECGFTAETNYGIPCLIKKDDRGMLCQKFLGNAHEDVGKKIQSPHKKWSHGFLRRFLGQEIIHFLNLLYFSLKFGPKNIFRKVCCADLRKALDLSHRGFYRGYFNLLLKTSEMIQFKKMKQYIQEESLEIGCGECGATNLIFDDIVDSITFGCEYYMDGYLNQGYMNEERDKQLYKVIKHHVGGSFSSMPFQSSVFSSVVMVHIIDHIVHIDEMFDEIGRILKPGGHLLMTTLSKNTFDNLSSVKLRSAFSKKWGNKYKEWRITKQNPKGAPFKSDFVYDGQGQNLFSINEWKELSGRFGFELADYSFFGKDFAHFNDIERRGYYNSLFFNNYIHSVLSEIIENEKKNPTSEEDATNVILVFKKVA